MYGELTDHRLAGTGRCGDEHPVAVLERGARGDLERVERERVTGGELGESRVIRIAPAPGSGVPLGRGRGHMDRLR